MDQVRDLQGGWDMDWVAKPRGWGSMKQSPAGSRLQVAPVPSRISFGIRTILILWMVGLSVISSSLFGQYQAVQCAGSSRLSVGPGGALCDSLKRNMKSCPRNGWSCHVQQYRLARGQFSREEPWTQMDELLNVGSQWQRPAMCWAVLVKVQPAARK